MVPLDLKSKMTVATIGERRRGSFGKALVGWLVGASSCWWIKGASSGASRQSASDHTK